MVLRGWQPNPEVCSRWLRSRIRFAFEVPERSEVSSTNAGGPASLSEESLSESLEGSPLIGGESIASSNCWVREI